MHEPAPPVAYIVRPVCVGRAWTFVLTNLRTGERHRLVGWRALRQFLNAATGGLH
jgi:hypothetical protein